MSHQAMGEKSVYRNGVSIVVAPVRRNVGGWGMKKKLQNSELEPYIERA
jgi:hypothetical protein